MKARILALLVPFIASIVLGAGSESSSDDIVSPAQAARVQQVQHIYLSDVDSKAGTAILNYDHLVGGSSRAASVSINLVTGELSAIRRKPDSSAEDDDSTSPSGRFFLEFAEGPPANILIKDKKGGKALKLSERDIPDFMDVEWCPRKDVLSMKGDIKGTDNESGLYLYFVEDRKLRLIVRGLTGHSWWSSDGRYLICLRQSPAAKKMARRTYDLLGTIVVLDADRGFKTVLSAGELADTVFLSPSNTRLAFIDRVKDEYGDLDNRALRVADLRTGRVNNVAVNRRKISYMWVGDDALAVTTYDKHAVPTLNLIPATGGSSTRLVTTPEFAFIQPAAYLPNRKLAVYVATTLTSDDKPYELWAVQSGRKPVRLFPKNVRAQR